MHTKARDISTFGLGDEPSVTAASVIAAAVVVVASGVLVQGIPMCPRRAVSALVASAGAQVLEAPWRCDPSEPCFYEGS